MCLVLVALWCQSRQLWLDQWRQEVPAWWVGWVVSPWQRFWGPPINVDGDAVNWICVPPQGNAQWRPSPAEIVNVSAEANLVMMQYNHGHNWPVLSEATRKSLGKRPADGQSIALGSWKAAKGAGKGAGKGLKAGC